VGEHDNKGLFYVVDSFSRRQGLVDVKAAQMSKMDKELRTGLWNALIKDYWNQPRSRVLVESFTKTKLSVKAIWDRFYKLPLDKMPLIWDSTLYELHERFFALKWNEVYDCIEFMATLDQACRFGRVETFINDCYSVLVRECSAYRFVGGIIAPVTNDQELSEIEQATASPHDAIRIHIETSLQKLSSRENPDYRNSIKESISAVEAAVKLIDGSQKGSLPGALRRIKASIGLHPALEEGIQRLYGCTSDDQGIRHALMERSTLSLDDARFMLVSCSAIANYLLRLATAAGILPRQKLSS